MQETHVETPLLDRWIETRGPWLQELFRVADVAPVPVPMITITNERGDVLAELPLDRWVCQNTLHLT